MLKKSFFYLLKTFFFIWISFLQPLKASDEELEEAEVSEKNRRPNSSESCVIFSIDGGGIRGIIPALVLEKIQNALGEPLVHKVNLMAGTSTGAIIALGLNMPKDDKEALSDLPEPKYSPTDLLKIYSVNGQKIFSSSTWSDLWSGYGNLSPRYQADSLTGLAEHYFYDTKLSDAITNVVVPVSETARYRPYFFKSYLASGSEDKNFYMKDIIRAASAAPTYFEPALIKNLAGKEFNMVDGGVFMNNPATMALVEARTLFPLAKDFFLVSLGTGQELKSLPFESIKSKGGIRWIRPLIDLMMSMNSQTVDCQLTELLPDSVNERNYVHKRYFRFQPPLPDAYARLDNANPNNIKNLIYVAEDQISKKSGEIAVIVEELKRRESRQRKLTINEDFKLDEQIVQVYSTFALTPDIFLKI